MKACQVAKVFDVALVRVCLRFTLCIYKIPKKIDLIPLKFAANPFDPPAPDSTLSLSGILMARDRSVSMK